MAEFAFFSVWAIETPIDRVWEEIIKGENYPTWFPYVTDAEKIEPGDDAGVGIVIRARWRTALPYGFVFDARSTRAERPHLLELESTGDLEGTGRWELSEDTGITTVRYYWTVRANKPWMNLIAPLAAPAFAWNHAVLMKAGGEGLARRLGAGLRVNRSYTATTPDPALPLLQTLGMLALGLWMGRRLRRLFGGSERPLSR